MTAIYDWPTEWYCKIVTQKFRVRAMSQVANRPWLGGKNVSGPYAKAWFNDVTMAPVMDPDRQDMDAFFAHLSGQAGIIRMSDAARLAPYHDRALTAGATAFSDGSSFSDTTAFVDGYLPPEVYVAAVAQINASFIVLGGFPASTPSLIRRGDLLQLKPSGIAGSVPNLYAAMFSSGSDANGRIGVEITPSLRTGANVGDQVGLRNAATLFRVADDTQGEMETTGAGQGNFGFSLVEALDLIA